jgi:hypothetical protein
MFCGGVVGKAVFDRKVFALDVARFGQTRRNAAITCASIGPAQNRPISGIAGCCALTASGHAVAPAITDMNSRLLIAAPKAQDNGL